MKVSIGICAYNEENNIGHLIANILDQPMPASLLLREIIVVSSGSTDRTDEIIRRMRKMDRRIKLVSEKEREGKAQALNAFLDIAEGDVMVVISADTRLELGSLAQLIGSMGPSVGGVCGKTMAIDKNGTIMEVCNSFLWDMHNGLLEIKSRDAKLGHLGGDMWAIRKGIISRIPRDVINDDAYLGVALRQKGWQLVYVPTAHVLIKGPATPHEYIQQRERILIGHRQVKEMTGVEPSTIGVLAFRDPLLSLRIFIVNVRCRSFLDLPKIPIGLFLEAMAQILARVNYKKRSTFLKWKQIQSTKNVDLQHDRAQ